MGSLWDVNLKLNVVGGVGQKAEKGITYRTLLTGSRYPLTPDLFNHQFLKLPNFLKQFLFPWEA